MNILAHSMKKIKEVGLINVIVGTVKREKYKKLQKRYQFDSWHISPYELRKYAQVTAAYINEHKPEAVVDIGCGLGEILRHIQCPVKKGFDEQQAVLDAAKLLCHKEDIEFVHGSFNKVNDLGRIDYLITLGFMHGGDESMWTASYHEVAKRNDVRRFLVDTLPADGPTHHLNFSMILPEDYRLVDKLGPFLGGRFLEVYEKTGK